ncbi:hypothetical protein KBZ19_05130 [Synechococcus sp. L2F]|uniref:hypothetical protein n=1 Tax=Synechococcus sp. L2F TaxID=2823739 RepID=UPI0020CE69A8|nr:hypothetical protein [Synechococcus sp. L2F]MCP9827865.1 hypothetical protein [Synechococcus sp. L2F]
MAAAAVDSESNLTLEDTSVPRIAETTPLTGAAPVAHGVVRLEQAIALHDLHHQHVQKRSGVRTRRVGHNLLVAQLSTISATIVELLRRQVMEPIWASPAYRRRSADCGKTRTCTAPSVW